MKSHFCVYAAVLTVDGQIIKGVLAPSLGGPQNHCFGHTARQHLRQEHVIGSRCSHTQKNQGLAVPQSPWGHIPNDSIGCLPLSVHILQRLITSPKHHPHDQIFNTGLSWAFDPHTSTWEKSGLNQFKLMKGKGGQGEVGSCMLPGSEDTGRDGKGHERWKLKDRQKITLGFYFPVEKIRALGWYLFSVRELRPHDRGWFGSLCGKFTQRVAECHVASQSPPKPEEATIDPAALLP